MKHFAGSFCSALLSVCLTSVVLLAQPATRSSTTVPRLVKFSGALTHTDGTPLTGTVGVTFSLYAGEHGGAPLWMETQNVQADRTGRYTAMLGATRNEGISTEVFASGQGRWLSVQPQGEPERPRVQLASVPYALNAADAETLGGLPASAFALAGGSLPAGAPKSVAPAPAATPDVTGTGTANHLAYWTNSTTLGTSALYQTAARKIGLGTTTPGAQLEVDTSTTTAILGNATASSGSFNGVIGQTASTGGNGVVGSATASSGFTNGVLGQSASTGGVGVGGTATASTGSAFGVYGQSASNSGAGVNGNSTATSGFTSGVFGSAASPNGNGVQGTVSATSGNGVIGINNATSGFAVGVNGQTASPAGAGVNGFNSATTGGNGGNFVSAATSGNSNGIYAQSASTSGTGVLGQALATSGNTNGVFGSAASPNGFGVQGYNSASGGAGVLGVAAATSGGATGVYGTSASPTGFGVQGNAAATSGNTNGVFGSAASPNGFGVQGYNTASGGAGVNGNAAATSGSATGVYGSSASPSGFGLQGADFAGGVGVQGSSTNVAVAGFSQTCGGSGCTLVPGIAGEFVTAAGGTILRGIGGTTQVFSVDSSGNGVFAGNLKVTGRLTKGSGSFMIDHPLDPANKYLSHSFVESPDMMNVYNGIVRLDAKGAAWVTLPDYFEALNGDFRYQLTAIGAPAPQLYIAREVSQNRFRIAGGRPGGRVSWQVTGIRHDAYANAHRIPVTEDKSVAEQGTYLHPDVYASTETRP